MIEQLKVYEGPVLAFALIDGFTDADYELVQKWAEAKREQGFTKVNLLLKLDEFRMAGSSAKAMTEQLKRLMKNFRQLGRIAIVGKSKLLELMVPVDNFFFQKFSEGSEERYFDVSEIDNAFAFVESAIQE